MFRNSRLKVISIMVVVITISSIGATVGWASGVLPGGGWYSTESIQNISGGNAGISVTAYDSASVTSYPSTGLSLASNTAITFLPSDFPGMPTGFTGSAIVSSDQPVVAIGTVTNIPSGSFGVAGGRARGRYQATLIPQTTLFYPLVKHNWYGGTTLFYIQNAEASLAITATAVFRMDNGQVFTYTTPSINPGQMVVVSPADAGVPTNGNSGNRNNIGGLTVTSSHLMAGAYVEYRVGESKATAISSMRGLALSDIDTTAYAPIIKRAWYGRFTGLNILNADTVPITVTASYTGTLGACQGKTYQDVRTNVQPGQSANIVQISTQSVLPDSCLAAGTFTAAGKKIVSIINEQQSSGANEMIIFAGGGFSGATTKLAAPVFVDQYVGSSTGLQLQNVGAVTATNVVVSFYCKRSGNPDFTAVTQPMSITAGASYQFYRPSRAVYNSLWVPGTTFYSNSNCSVIATGDQPLQANINEGSDVANALDDANYEGFSLTP